MSDIPNDRSYTKDHEWAQVDPTDPNFVLIGISDYAQDKLGDIVMVELPEIGDTVQRDDPCGTIESPKSVSDIFSPVSGEVVAINDALEDEPELANSSPYEDGWIVRVQLDGTDGIADLMDAEAYAAYIAELEED